MCFQEFRTRWIGTIVLFINVYVLQHALLFVRNFFVDNTHNEQQSNPKVIANKEIVLVQT